MKVPAVDTNGGKDLLRKLSGGADCAHSSNSGRATGLEAPGDCEDEDNQEDQSNSAHRIISPAAAVRPGGERSD
jgi:hypothetical protein